MGQFLSIGNIAQACGMSIRSLRHLETHGLIQPVRTEAGRRVYSEEHVHQLSRILLLKRAGYRLGDIARIIQNQTLDPKALLDVQITCLTRQKAAITRALSSLKEARALLQAQKHLDATGLCTLIREGERLMMQKAMHPVLDQYFIKADKQRWEELAQTLFPPDKQTLYQQQWSTLITRIETAMETGLDATAPAAKALAQEWLALQAPLAEALRPEHWGRAAKMYSEMDQWKTEERTAPFSKEVYIFISRAAKALKNPEP
ncbi:MerR family transcriptional regulator [Acetobacter farinalis]|uniref:MerR family transcriptional regulator n=1 Tax=Acetobacter farinalis TaxID=1260984 RepID=A0ABT3Q9L4_9PROT|nr:MerR family transcriptional regulator [Acetobacter farinalis]MCX2561980.1 MerR family transcriptional regulator [Acetobacter farinalis]